eukprot:jgi/Bigna1/132719/aug1.18_g7427
MVSQVSFTAFVFVVAFFMPGFIAGASTSGAPWAHAEISIIDNVDNLTTSRCTRNYKFALTQYEVENDCAGIKEKDVYDSDACDKSRNTLI